MARVKTVQKCRKDQAPCGKCGKPIPKGSPYRHFAPGFRARKRVRCMALACSPRPSELTGSDKISRCYAAQENVEDAITGWDRETLSDLVEALEGPRPRSVRSRGSTPIPQRPWVGPERSHRRRRTI